MRRRRRWKIVGGSAIGLVAAAIPVTFFVLDDGEPSRRLRSDLVAESGAALPISSSPTGYTLTYRVDNYSGNNATTSTEAVAVRRPFDGSVVLRKGTPPGGEQQLDVRSNYSLVADYTAKGSPQVSASQPRIAFGDLRLDASLDDLVAQKLFVPRERRRALGRQCQVYRTGSALESLEVTAPTDTNWADVCVDAAGIMLEEVVVTSGKLSAHLTATEVADDATPGDDAFKIDGTPLTLDQGGATFVPIDTATAPQPGYWKLNAAPVGYDYRGRYKLTVPAQASSTTTSTTQPAAPAETFVEVYVNGTNAVIVQQGAKANEPSIDTSVGTDVQVGTLGAAKYVPGVAGNTLVAHPRDDWYVHVTATVNATTVQQIAGGLSL